MGGIRGPRQHHVSVACPTTLPFGGGARYGGLQWGTAGVLVHAWLRAHFHIMGVALTGPTSGHRLGGQHHNQHYDVRR
eukprot:7732663-Pyramimonas_sp.AAC.1